MKAKLALVAGVAAGYVLGTRAGREQYVKLRSQARTLWKDPKVQEQVGRAQDVVKEQAPVVGAKIASVTRSAADTVTEKASSSRRADVEDDAGAGI